MSQQRQVHKEGHLSQERTTRLEGIGFVWNLKRGPREASTRAQSDLPADENHTVAGRGSIDSSTPPVQEDVDCESHTLPFDSPIEMNGYATETVSM